MSSASAFTFERYKILSFARLLTLSQTSPVFYVSAVQVFLQTLWKKEKLLVTSSFSFSHSVFYPFEALPDISINFKVVFY